MIYLESISFPDADREFDFILKEKHTCYDTFYPFQILPRHHLEQLVFEPVTILYGGNGTGKSTVLNIIAEKLGLNRESRFNRSNFYPDYLHLCSVRIREPIPENSSIITSDDVFDYMLNIRSLNEGLDRRREEIFEEYLDAKYSNFRMKSMGDYERLKKVNSARRKTQSQFVRQEMMDNIREYSNGESAFHYFAEKIEEQGLYLLDEPENSLSVERQQELLTFLENSARFFGCQFVISTHSPFILAARGARIYDLDEDPVDVKKWSELGSVRVYYEFFQKHQDEFEED
ncbi:MAG: AAA family ATPase [Fusicatenibacter sp.]|nr:AAA family ATPase [Fusicatenibacter sp.]